MRAASKVIDTSRRNNFLKILAALFVQANTLFLPGCVQESPPPNETPESSQLKPVTVDLYLNDLTGNHGRSNWLVLLSYQRHYSSEQGVIQQRTNEDGFARIVIPWNTTDVGVRFALAIRETPDGKDWNDSNFPSYLDGWSQEWTLDEGTFRNVNISIEQPYTTWTLTSTSEIGGATATAPITTSTSSTLLNPGGAILYGSVNPNGSSTIAWFEYGTTPSLSSYTGTAPQAIGSGTSALNLDNSIASLSSNTTYYYRIAASNSAGTNRGSILSFLAAYSYSSITGAWSLSTRSDFSNSAFTGSLSINLLSLIQTNELLPGYSTVYKVTGTFTSFALSFQRKSDGTLFPLYQNASGSISNAGINSGITSHNLEFYLGASSNYHLRGVAPDYASMWGDITVTVDMTTIFGTPDGVVTLTGMWDANRR